LSTFIVHRITLICHLENKKIYGFGLNKFDVKGDST